MRSGRRQVRPEHSILQEQRWCRRMGVRLAIRSFRRVFDMSKHISACRNTVFAGKCPRQPGPIKCCIGTLGPFTKIAAGSSSGGGSSSASNYTLSRRECGQFRHYVHENLENFKMISTPMGSCIRSRRSARSNSTARRGRKHFEFFEIFMNIRNATVHTLDGTQYK